MLVRLTPLALLLLAGCAGTPHAPDGLGPHAPEQEHPSCSDSAPDTVQWAEPGLVDRLRRVDAEGWNVTFTPRPSGFSVDDLRVADWNASVRVLYRDASPGRATIALHADGLLRLETQGGPRGEEHRDALHAFLAEVTDTDDAPRSAWVEGLLGNGSVHPGYTDGRDPAQLPWRYQVRIPHDAAVADRVLQHLSLGMPTRVVSQGGWGASFSFDAAAATDGVVRLVAKGASGTFEADWPPGTSSNEAIADFQDAYRALALGDPPWALASSPSCL